MPLTAFRIIHQIVHHIDRALRKAGPHMRYSEFCPRYSTTEPGGRRRLRGGSHHRSLPRRLGSCKCSGKRRIKKLSPFTIQVFVTLAKNGKDE